MKTESIIRVLDSIFGKIDSFSDEELNSVDTLLVSRFGFDKKVQEVDFNDLVNFPNLNTLTIDGCMLDIATIKLISSLLNLKKIYLYNCEVVEDIYDVFNELNIKELCLSNTDFDISRLTGKYDRLQLEGINLKKVNCKVSIFDIFGCEIKDINELLECNYDTIVISPLQYISNQLLFDDSNKKIIVMEENGQFVSKKVGF